MSQQIVAPETRNLDELAKRLTAWMSGRIAGASALRIHNLAYPRGAGQSHETILFDAEWRADGVDRRHGFVVRVKPQRFTVFPDDLFDQQFRLMQVLHAGGYVRVARPVWFEVDPAILGAPFFVMDKVVGRVPVSVPSYSESGWVFAASAVQRRRMWEGGVRQLAAVQSVPLHEVRFLEGPAGAREGLAQELDKYTRFVAWVQEPRPWPVLEAGLARLRSLSPKNQPPGLVWGDARIGNIMFDENFAVVAVMDWEQPSLGGALQDLGWWLVLSETMHGATKDRPFLEGMGTRAETIALWESVTGISAAEIEWYEDFTRLKMSCMGVRMSHLRGAAPPDEAWLARRLKVD